MPALPCLSFFEPRLGAERSAPRIDAVAVISAGGGGRVGDEAGDGNGGGFDLFDFGRHPVYRLLEYGTGTAHLPIRGVASPAMNPIPGLAM